VLLKTSKAARQKFHPKSWLCGKKGGIRRWRGGQAQQLVKNSTLNHVCAVKRVEFIGCEAVKCGYSSKIPPQGVLAQQKGWNLQVARRSSATTQQKFHPMPCLCCKKGGIRRWRGGQVRLLVKNSTPRRACAAKRVEFAGGEAVKPDYSAKIPPYAMLVLQKGWNSQAARWLTAAVQQKFHPKPYLRSKKGGNHRLRGDQARLLSRNSTLCHAYAAKRVEFAGGEAVKRSSSSKIPP